MKQQSQKSFKEKVYAVVRKIPRGQVLTYKQVAALAGNPKASRAVGNLMNKNYAQDIPCHRVIRSDNKIGGYNRGTLNKVKILINEGHKIIDGKLYE
ncbi:MAG TPA: MGMT family protein [Candidatus Gracilibacteria bacterium]|nr:MGMT family protein [Candidatus Gracilibacteria bacterium]